MIRKLCLHIVFFLFLLLLFSKVAYAEQLIYPTPAPDSRTMQTKWINVNVNPCGSRDSQGNCQTTYDNQSCNGGDALNILQDNGYRHSEACGYNNDTKWYVRKDTTGASGTTKSSYAGQTIKIPSTINRITRINFDEVWVGNDTSVKGIQVGMNSTIRVYRGASRTTLIGEYAGADVPWSNAAASSTQATFSPSIVVIPGETIYFELYSEDNLDTRNGGIVVQVPLANKNNNGSVDSYPDGAAFYNDNTRYQFTPQPDYDLARVSVYGDFVGGGDLRGDGPQINGMLAKNVSNQEATGTGGTRAGDYAFGVSGLQANQGGLNWLNPIRLGVSASPGTTAQGTPVEITQYFVSFYDKNPNLLSVASTNSGSTFIASVQQRLGNPQNGYLVAYARNPNNPQDTTSPFSHYVWNPTANNWQIITTPRQVCNGACSISTLLYTVSPVSAKNWEILFDKNFGTKNMYTAVYVKDANNKSDFMDNIPACDASSASCSSRSVAVF